MMRLVHGFVWMLSTLICTLTVGSTGSPKATVGVGTLWRCAKHHDIRVQNDDHPHSHIFPALPAVRITLHNATIPSGMVRRSCEQVFLQGPGVFPFLSRPAARILRLPTQFQIRNDI
ncbi:hypothetical protein F5Y07DRAFT_372628, partial [Xylaria sp. FL0933]